MPAAACIFPHISFGRETDRNHQKTPFIRKTAPGKRRGRRPQARENTLDNQLKPNILLASLYAPIITALPALPGRCRPMPSSRQRRTR